MWVCDEFSHSVRETLVNSEQPVIQPREALLLSRCIWQSEYSTTYWQPLPLPSHVFVMLFPRNYILSSKLVFKKKKREEAAPHRHTHTYRYTLQYIVFKLERHFFLFPSEWTCKMAHIDWTRVPFFLAISFCLNATKRISHCRRRGGGGGDSCAANWRVFFSLTSWHI